MKRLKRLILVACSDIKDCNQFKDFLITQNFEVIVTNSGEWILSEAIKVKPDLIIIDTLSMKTGGKEVITLLRANQEIGRTPVILVDALRQHSDFYKMAKAYGANGWLSFRSLFNPHAVVKEVYKALGLRRR